MGNRFTHEAISPAELDALWNDPPYTLAAVSELFPPNDIMTADEEAEAEVEAEGRESNWRRKEALSGSSTISSGERFSPDVVLLFSGRRRSSVQPDVKLQEALRTRLRVVESNSQDVAQLFKDLSARLVSVHAEKDSFVITFKTVEEIWKFSTYLALGYVARCLENFLCDQSLWLDPALLCDVEICVTVDEDHLATLYLGLLVQEGTFFAKALGNSDCREDEDELTYMRNDLIMVKDIGQEPMWEGTQLSTGQHGQVPLHDTQPLPYPFYQWFLKKYPGNAGGVSVTESLFDHSIVVGTCVAIVDHYPVVKDELHLHQGDIIKIEGFLFNTLNIFIGKHLTSGEMGFVQKAHVKPENIKPLNGQLVFLSEEERAALSKLNPCFESCQSDVMGNFFSSDISTVYRLDRLDDSDFTYIRNHPKSEQKTPVEDPRKSTISEKSDATPYHSSPRPSFYTSRNHLERDAEVLSFSLEDTFREMDEYEEDPLTFMDEGIWEADEAEMADPILTFLNLENFQDSLETLYDLRYCFLDTVFSGLSEDEVLQHLENLREGAKKGRMLWAHRRACFLLGRLCAKKLKYSQARVYFEEALKMPVNGFDDEPLLIALYTNLTAVYLKQKMMDKLRFTLEKASALILCLPCHNFCSADEFELLKPIMRKAIIEKDKYLEARTCYLCVSLFLRLRKVEDALPFVERLQFLTITLSADEERPIAPVDLNWMLCRLYHKKYLPYLTLASISLDSEPEHSLDDAFQKIELFIKNSARLNPHWKESTSVPPAQVVVYLQQALSIASRGKDLKTQRDLCLCLASVYQQHGAPEKAVPFAHQAARAGRQINEEEGFEASVLLAWLLVLTEQPEQAQSTLYPLLNSLNETDSPAQRGVVYNLLALCLRKQGRVQEGAKNFHCALQISRENGNKRNEALALANMGCLCLSVGASGLAECFLLNSLQLYQFLSESPTDEEHVQTLLWLGRSYKDRGGSQEVRLCYEMGLLIAISAKNLHSQMVVANILSRHYADLLLYGQCIVYYEHCVGLCRTLKNKQLEGEYLELLSTLYLSLNTEKSSRKSLDYSKQSLRISIDLGKRQEESETWLQVGRIYYLIHEDELADMYLQAAVKTALKMNDPCFAMSIYEEAGDVFFKGHRNRLAALPFFRDGSLPFARSIKDVHSEFRLLGKLTELLMKHKQYEEALQYATLAVQVSTTTDVPLNERVSFHRLASVYFSLGKYEMAENYYLKSLSLCPVALEHAIDVRYNVKVYCRLADLTLYKLKDAFDAMGYFHLALAAALEDKESLSTLYIIYMKLAEIHANHMPDAELCKRYMDSAQNLRRELAGYSDSTDTHQDHANAYCAESVAQTNAGLSHSSIGPESSMTDTSLMIPSQGESEFMVSNISHKEDIDTRFSEKTDSEPSDHTNPETTCTDNTNHTNGSTLTEGLTFVI
ncbi:SH3 domain and tetratricopeptide repeat-containing protein 2 isoform X4 [Triplophysa rosa]|uniref:SH3 domain and tetratricopeptide repeat-containing protein 2 isoform X4 n=1 Tax=Triplophysa rosa TaxID=992332 RepID=UPI002545F3C1|nr:SH3 domain and tetratricopeptide repeat-containing protein 2 isoform X4 [Triplophysa rosa]XP_057206196.1 SH3 domain and tetratricopeptide repeat-containing protein 2 isoform X4 [Triplophysa rosa]